MKPVKVRISKTEELQKRETFVRQFDKLADSLKSEEGLRLFDEKEVIYWINPKLKRGTGNNLNFYAFNRIDFTELNQLLNNIHKKEERLKGLGYNLGGIKSFNRNVWLDLSRESNAIEGILDDFALPLLDFRTQLRGNILKDDKKDLSNKQHYFRQLLEKIENTPNDATITIEGNTQTHTLNVSTLRHFVALKYAYHSAKYDMRHREEATPENFLNILLNTSGLLFNNQITGFRKEPVYVVGAPWIPVSETKVRDKMQVLADWVTDESISGKLHPIEKAALFHVEYIRIHPFMDGNGRTGRIMSNYILIKNEMPTVSLRQKNTKEYFEALDKAVTTHEADDLIGMFYEAALDSAHKIDACLDYIEKNTHPSRPTNKEGKSFDK